MMVLADIFHNKRNLTVLSTPLMSEYVQRNQQSKINPKMTGQTFLKMLCISPVANCQNVVRSSGSMSCFAPVPGTTATGYTFSNA